MNITVPELKRSDRIYWNGKLYQSVEFDMLKYGENTLILWLIGFIRRL